MNVIRWGLLSTANINRRVIPAIRMSPRGELAAVASRDLPRAQSYAHEWEIPKAFGSYEAMLNSGEIDALYISLPNHMHAEWTVRALQAGVNVLCEKPFAVTMEEVDRMIAASRETGKVLAEAFMYRHHPQTKLIGEWVHGGRLGEIVQVRGIFTFKIDHDQPNVRLLPPDQGGGSLWDVGVYPISMAQYVFGGPPEQVYGRQWTGPTGVDETFVGQMSYAGSGLGQVACGFRTPFHTYVDIMGTEGSLMVERPFTGVDDGRLLYQADEGPAQPIHVPRQELYLGEIEDMQAAILDGTPSLITLDETRNHVRTALALYESARTGEVVRLG